MKRKTIWIACGAAALLCLLAFIKLKTPAEEPDARQYFTPPTQQPATPAPDIAVSAPEPSATPTPEPYVSPVDFEALFEANEDAYAWLYIPGTEISYPLLQHPGDDTYYLRRNLERNSDANGVIYTEASYNGTDFTDPLTVAYGHNMNSGLMFGSLQSTYSSAEALKEYSELVVYLPDKELHYTVFAAVPFDNRHILYNYDFTDERTFRLFFNEILSVRALDAVFAEDVSVQPEDKVLILSTCLKGNRANRFLVCGKLTQIIQ